MRNPNISYAPAARLLGAGPVSIWELHGDARLSRALLRLGVEDCAHWPAPVLNNSNVLLLDAGFIIEDSLLRALMANPNKFLLDPASGRIAGAHVPVAHAAAIADLMQRQSGFDATQLPAGLAASVLSVDAMAAYNEVVKKRVTGFILPIRADTKIQIEKQLFSAAYKGVTDIVTKYVWPWPAFHVTRACAALGITPNMVTSLSAVCVVLAFYLFMQGQFGWGLVAAWGMTFLDTVDGKLARVTITSSPLGNIFDHGIDLVHPPFWYWAWSVGIAVSGGLLWQAEMVMLIVIGGYIAQRLVEGGFKLLFGFTPHVWRRFDSQFRLITARRNPNLILLSAGALAGYPELAMLAVAGWTVISICVHFLQLAQAATRTLRGQSLQPWLAS